MIPHKTLNVHLPEWLYRDIENQALRQKTTKGAVARERLGQIALLPNEKLIGDLFGIAKDLPSNLSTKKDFPRYGQDGHR